MISTATQLSDVQLWQRNLASLIRSGLFLRAEVVAANGLFTVVGLYRDGSASAPLAKYGDERRATDALDVIERLARIEQPADRN